MTRTSLSLVFAGSGGSGAMTAGSLFLRAAAGGGYFGVMTQLFGAQVRGGESAALVQISIEPIECQPDRFDAFLCARLGQGSINSRRKFRSMKPAS